MPTWDEKKRKRNVREHGLDFEGCEKLFEGPVFVYEDSREIYGELRLCAIGWLEGLVVHMTYTEHEEDFRVISLRKAEKHEIKQYIKEISR